MNSKKLYYYCSPQVFESIIKNKEFWLSDVSKSNDYSEIVLFLERVKKVLKNKIITNTTSRSDFEKYKFYYTSAIRDIDFAITNGYYLAMCFTSLDDSLSQWRAYGCDGNGFAIGVDLYQLQNCRKAYGNDYLLGLEKVSYSITEMDSTIDDLVAKFNASIKYANYKKGSSLVPAEVRKWSNEVVIKAPYFKTGGFSVEEETRLCYSRITTVEQMQNIQRDSHLNYWGIRVTNNDCIPFMRFPIKDFSNLITSVTIGPRNNASNDIVKFMLAKYGFNESIQVRKSKITYRGK